MHPAIIQALDRPTWAIGRRIRGHNDLTLQLPGKAQDAGLKLRSIDYDRDPIFLHDKEGRLLFEWPYGYEPGYFEVEKVCRRFL